MTFKTRTVIEFDYHYIKTLQSSAVGASPVQSLINIKDNSDEEIIHKLAALKADHRFSFNDSQIIVSISRQLAFVRHLDLPSKNLKQINSMVDLLSSNSTPYSREETVVDFIPLEKNQEGFTKVCVVIAPLETIDRIFNIFQKAKLIPHQISLSSLGLWYWYKDYKSSSFDTTLLIVRDSYRTEFCILDSQKLITSRCLENQPSSELFNQIKLTIEGYNKEKLDAPLKKIAIVASQENLSDLKIQLQSAYSLDVDLMSARNGDSFDGVALYSLSGFLKTKENILIDLRSLSSKSTRFVSAHQWLRLMILSVLAILSLLISFNLSFINDAVLLYRLKNMIKQSEAEVILSKQKLHQFDLIESAKANHVILADMINEIYNSVSKSVALTSINLKDHVLLLQGTAAQSTDILEMQRMLNNNQYFENITLEQSNTEKIEFKINCHIKLKGKSSENI